MSELNCFIFHQIKWKICRKMASSFFFSILHDTYFQINQYSNMKSVEIPTFEGHSTVVVFPSKSEKVFQIIFISSNFYFDQDLSYAYLLYNKEKTPMVNGKHLLVEYKPSHIYCVIPSYTDQGALLYYPSRPDFLKYFKFCQGISKV